MGTARLILRASVGALFVGHGLQKLAGWFGGGGPEGTGQFFEQVGLRPGKETALATGAAEAGGGVLLALGLATPLASAMLSGVMVGAIRRIHWQNGPWSANGGYEYNLTILAALAALTETGPGPLSLDRALGIERRGPAVAFAAFGAGAAAALAGETLAPLLAPPERTPAQSQEREPVPAMT